MPASSSPSVGADCQVQDLTIQSVTSKPHTDSAPSLLLVCCHRRLVPAHCATLRQHTHIIKTDKMVSLSFLRQAAAPCPAPPVCAGAVMLWSKCLESTRCGADSGYEEPHAENATQNIFTTQYMMAYHFVVKLLL